MVCHGAHSLTVNIGNKKSVRAIHAARFAHKPTTGFLSCLLYKNNNKNKFPNRKLGIKQLKTRSSNQTY